MAELDGSCQLTHQTQRSPTYLIIIARIQQTQGYQELQKRYLLTQVSLSPEQIQTTHH